MMARIKEQGLHPLDARNWMQQDFDKEFKLGRDEMKHDVLKVLATFYGDMPDHVYDTLHTKITKL